MTEPLAADDDTRERLIWLVKKPPTSWKTAAEIADAIVANPDVVLRALGGEQVRKATTRIGTIETWTVTFERLHDGTIGRQV